MSERRGWCSSTGWSSLTREFHFEESNGLGMGGKLGVVGIREFTNGKTVRVEDGQ